MKKISLILLLGVFVINVNAQNTDLDNTGFSSEVIQKGENDIICYATQQAHPKGGFDLFKENLKLHEELGDKIKRPLTLNFILVKIRFVVEKDGSLTNMRILKDKFNVANDVFKIIKEKSKWEPAIFNNKIIHSQITLPLKIALD